MYIYYVVIVCIEQWIQLSVSIPYIRVFVMRTAFPCLIFNGDTYLDMMFPGAVENMGRNLGILAAYVPLLWILVVVVFKARGIKQLHWM